MAAINPTLVTDSGNSAVVQWTPVATGDTCKQLPTRFADYTDRSIQAAGTFGGGTVNVTGSNDGANFSNLSDPQGLAIALTAAGLKAVLEPTLVTVPALVGGAAGSVTITMFLRRGRGGKEV